MSLYRNSATAIRHLLVDESLHAQDHRGFFTDLDVAVLASEIGGGYSENQMADALTEANLALGKFYRANKVVRFGPVRVLGLLDHARIATRIVYASPTGPRVFETPNGKFKRLTAERDPLRCSGRRAVVVNRDDRESWSEQFDEEDKLRARLAMVG
jgi:hypothetical protein